MSEQHGLRVFENRVLRNIFWPKSDDITEEWRRLRKEQLYDLYTSRGCSNQKNDLGGTYKYSTYGGEERFMQDFCGETSGKETI
jgi:hypothetical protein